MTRLGSATATRRSAISPVRIWCGLGAAVLVVQAWILFRWAVADGIHIGFDRDAGVSPIRAGVVWILQGATVVACIVVVSVLIRQCRREHRITFDTAVTVGFTLCAWQDPLLDLARPVFFHSYYSLHFDPNWGPHLPGWSHAELDHPITLAIIPGGIAYPVMITCIWLQFWLVARISRWRRIRRSWQVWLVGAASGAVVVLAFESVLIAAGIYSYPHAIRALSLWPGHWYQYPLTEMATWIAFLTTITMMRYYAVTKGTPAAVFRDGLRREDNRAWARLLAGIGLANAAMISYVIVNVALTAFGGPTPTDTPGYLLPR
ncbi:spirocyclase AveC family protein [Nocardia brasiliensis]|uniref:spirocyclase AveC family protein n=1 Tax=Nocardia brasiliensis TaxID=37326 RepID=UPI001893126D|nr:spirocyclase AveC family protein [Nocardia brasiliensis]MBF6130195.1 spirocyclase AveC family protein [Nocardia brasiliensis]